MTMMCVRTMIAAMSSMLSKKVFAKPCNTMLTNRAQHVVEKAWREAPQREWPVVCCLRILSAFRKTVEWGYVFPLRPTCYLGMLLLLFVLVLVVRVVATE